MVGITVRGEAAAGRAVWAVGGIGKYAGKHGSNPTLDDVRLQRLRKSRHYGKDAMRLGPQVVASGRTDEA